MSEFRPSGSMCVACERRYKTCDHYAFDQMPVMKLDKDGTKVVRCTQFKRVPQGSKEGG